MLVSSEFGIEKAHQVSFAWKMNCRDEQRYFILLYCHFHIFCLVMHCHHFISSSNMLCMLLCDYIQRQSRKPECDKL